MLKQLSAGDSSPAFFVNNLDRPNRNGDFDITKVGAKFSHPRHTFFDAELFVPPTLPCTPLSTDCPGRTLVSSKAEIVAQSFGGF